MFTTAMLLVLSIFISLAFLMWSVNHMVDSKARKDIEDRSNKK